MSELFCRAEFAKYQAFEKKFIIHNLSLKYYAANFAINDLKDELLKRDEYKYDFMFEVLDLFRFYYYNNYFDNLEKYLHENPKKHRSDMIEFGSVKIKYEAVDIREMITKIESEINCRRDTERAKQKRIK